MATPPTSTKDDSVGESENPEPSSRHGMEIVVFNEGAISIPFRGKGSGLSVNNDPSIRDEDVTIRGEYGTIWADDRPTRADDLSRRDDERSTRAVRKTPWTQADEKLLAKAWLYISGNSDTKDSQPIKNFWRQVGEYYNSNIKNGVKRKANNLKSHWFLINHQVNDFNRCFIKIKSELRSGWLDHQIKDAARETYYSTYRKTFKYEHVWNIVKSEPKWEAIQLGDHLYKKTKVFIPIPVPTQATYASSSDVPTINNVDEDVQVQPKAAKRKVKEKSVDINGDGRTQKMFEKFQMQKLEIMKRYTDQMEVKNKLKAEKQKMEDLQLLTRSTRDMTEEQIEMHQIICKIVRDKYNI